MALLKEPPTVAGEINTLLGKGASFEGKLTFEGTVRVDGRFKGDIFSDGVLIVGEAAEVEAEVEIGSILIEGSFQGNIRAKQGVEVHAPARVRGNLTTPALVVDKGVLFDGNCQMESAGQRGGPGAPAQRPPPAPPTAK